jgi:hypothetical protein
MPDILSFFGLSMEQWRSGFVTQQEVFEWLASSRFYAPGQLSDSASRAKARSTRGMYQAFFHWDDARRKAAAESNSLPREIQKRTDKEATMQSVKQDALIFFGKREEHDGLARANERRVRFKATWNGRKVGEWTGGSGRLIGKVMTLMRQTVGEEKISQMTEEELKQHVLQVKEAVELQFKQEQQAREEGQVDADVT